MGSFLMHYMAWCSRALSSLLWTLGNMDMDQGKSNKESSVMMDEGQSNFSTCITLIMLPPEILVHIISFLSSSQNKVKLRHVSRWLKSAIERTPSLLKEFVWPYYDSREECCLKEVFRVSGEHIKLLSFPDSTIPPTLVETLQYCSNVQHLSLPSTMLDPEQLRITVNHMRNLQTLEFNVDKYAISAIEQLFLNVVHLKELTVFSSTYQNYLEDLFKHWMLVGFRPLNFKFVTPEARVQSLLDYARIKLTFIPACTANFKVYTKSNKVPLKFTASLPYFQLHLDGSAGKVMTISPVKCSEFGHDLATMSDTQYGGRTYKARYQIDDVEFLNLKHITIFDDLTYTTYLNFTEQPSIDSSQLEQLAIACPNLQQLKLKNCASCLKSLQGLQAIAKYCPILKGLNILGICVSNVENNVLLWEILKKMELTYLAVEFCLVKVKSVNKERLICLYQECCTMRGIQSHLCGCEGCTNEDTSVLSYFPSLIYCYMQSSNKLPSIVQNVISNCKRLKCAFLCHYFRLSLKPVHNRYLQQLFIFSPATIVPDDFMASVSAHGGLVHVVMKVGYLKANSIMSLVSNSQNLITLHLCANALDVESVKNFDAKLKKIFWKRKLFTFGHYMIDLKCIGYLSDVLWKQRTDLLPLFN